MKKAQNSQTDDIEKRFEEEATFFLDKYMRTIINF